MKKFWTTAVAAVLAVGVIGAGDALAAKNKKEKKAGRGDDKSGMITKIDGKAPAVTLTVSTGRGKRAKETTVSTDDKTSVTVDGQAKAVSDLKVGEYVKLDAATGTVKSIDASTSAPAKKGKKKDA